MLSRHRLRPGTLCYLCGREILPDEERNRDHIPPQRFYGSDVRRRHNPNLVWLPTHVNCNASYKADEELFCTSFAPQAWGSPTANSVIEDLRRGFAKGHGVGLGRAVLGMYGKVRLPDGRMLFQYHPERTARLVWKIVRGLYTLETNRFLPPLIGHTFYPIFYGSTSEQQRVAPDWYPVIHNTASLGRYGAVLDYRWLGWWEPEHELRAHAMVLLFWDRLVCPMLFHDPAAVAYRRSAPPEVASVLDKPVIPN